VNLLKSEIKQHIQEDRTYRAVDDMKKKAIHKAGSYEEFKNFVACAEQRPVTSSEMDELKQQKGSWTQQKTRAEQQKKRERNLSKKDAKGRNLAKDFPTQPPATSMELERDFKRHCCGPKHSLADKWRYLRMVGHEGAANLWKTEIDAGIMGHVIMAVDWAVGEAAASAITKEVAYGWLDVMTKCGRFTLNVNFLEDKQLEAVGRVCEWLKQEGGEGVEELKGKYS
jgi:hypothetical protein